jgi:hypothetical protein
MMPAGCRVLLGFPILLAFLAVAACSPSVNRQGPAGPLSTWSRPGWHLSFRYPADWHHLDTPEYGFTHLQVIVYAGNVRLSNPCVRTPKTFFCASFPKVVMRRGRVLTRWSDISLMSVGRYVRAIGQAGKGRPLRIDGRPARLVTITGRALQCPAGTSEVLDAAIALPGNRDVLEMTACLSPPTGKTRTQVLAMLDSVRWRPEK